MQAKTIVKCNATTWSGYRPLKPDRQLQESNVGVYACLIMRDEADNIPVCLPDMAPLVDGYIISDTGSQDGSVAIAKRVGSCKRTCDVTSAAWVNYGYNRNVALRRLERVLQPIMEEKSHIKLSAPITWDEYLQLEQYRWYALVTDLDNTFHHCDETLAAIQAPLSKSARKRRGNKAVQSQDTNDKLPPVLIDRSWLTADAYFIASQRGGHVYRTNNLLRIDPLRVNRWYYYRSIHEYVDNREPWFNVEIGTIGGCYIEYGHSGYRSRDIGRALKDVIYLLRDDKLEPNDSRNFFYLAQSYLEAGCRDKAREYYQKRAELGNTWASERYISYLKLAQLVDRDKPDGDSLYLHYLFKGYELGLRRLEIAFEICDYFRRKELHRSAWAYASQLVSVDQVDATEYLIDSSVTNYKFWDVAGLAAYYCGHYAESARLTSKALAAPDLPDGYRTRLESNLRFSVEKMARG